MWSLRESLNISTLFGLPSPRVVHYEPLNDFIMIVFNMLFSLIVYCLGIHINSVAHNFNQSSRTSIEANGSFISLNFFFQNILMSTLSRSQKYLNNFSPSLFWLPRQMICAKACTVSVHGWRTLFHVKILYRAIYIFLCLVSAVWLFAFAALKIIIMIIVIGIII